MPITRTPMVDDDGTGQSGTVVNNSWKTELYNQIDAALGSGAFTTGTWQPQIGADGTVSPVGQTYAFREGVWVRVGPLVWINARVILSARGSIVGTSGSINNLPFPAATANVTGGAGTVQFGHFNGLGGVVAHMAGFVLSGLSGCAIVYTAAAAAGVGNLPLSYILDGTDLQFGGHYLAA